LEELLPKDNENIPLPDLGSIIPSEAQGFSADQMVRCGACARTNPPTRVNCIYCGAILPVNENSSRLQKPTLRRLESWEHGFNSILLPVRQGSLSPEAVSEASDLLKLSLSDFERILSYNAPLPLARAASEDEAALIARRLDALGVATLVVPDERLGSERMIRIRSATVAEEGLTNCQISGSGGSEVWFNQIVLLVFGRLFTKRVEVKERKSRRAENDIVNSSEFFSDVVVLDMHTVDDAFWRIEAGNFDFSLLGKKKGLVAGENLKALINLIRERAPQADFDESYASIRQALEPVWPLELRTEAIGWQRQRPGKYSTSGATESNNEKQFSRYSRLLFYFKMNPTGQTQ
jgi:hypothetical protein